MMKILVLSDSHSSLAFMRRCIDRAKPDCVVHLGDHIADAEALSQDYPHIRFHMVAGNCDQFYCRPDQTELLCYANDGVRFYMTHGHRQYVKSGLENLLLQARKAGADAVLFGHTHQSYCAREEDGLYVLNPGSCRGFGGSAGIVETQNGVIAACYLWRPED